jgi:aminodeoxyfutalosine deaminase
MCPVSNVRTGVVRSLAEHPIRRFMEAGILVSVNTDDPKMFDTSLAGEYAALREELDFQPREIQRLLSNAIRSTWADEATKSRLLEELEAALPGAE